MILLIDNYDSFTYNIYQMTGAFHPDIRVVKNDEYSVAQLAQMAPSHIMISPGPGRPQQAGVCIETVKYFAGKTPILGICLGHQALCEAFGAQTTYAKTLMHGKKRAVHIANGNPIFKGLPPILQAARYHSLACDRKTLPDELLVIAENDEGEVMGVKHKDYNIYGLQFHPESILTQNGKTIFENFIQIGAEVQ